MTRQEKTIVNTAFLPTSAGTQDVGAELRDVAEREAERVRERGVNGCSCVSVAP